MMKRLNFFLLLLLLASSFFFGCTSLKSTENLSNPEGTSKTWGSHALAQNVTVYHQFDNKTSYELSIDHNFLQGMLIQGFS